MKRIPVFRIAKEAVLTTALIRWKLWPEGGRQQSSYPKAAEYKWDDTLLSSSMYCLKLLIVWEMLTCNFLDVVFTIPTLQGYAGSSFYMCRKKPCVNTSPEKMHFLYYSHIFTFDVT